MTQFVICGHICPVHPEKRCELNTSHNRAGDVRHRSDNVVWDREGNHRHLGKFELVTHKIREESAAKSADGLPHIEVEFSTMIPPGQLLAFNRSLLNDRIAALFGGKLGQDAPHLFMFGRDTPVQNDGHRFWGDGPSGMTADPEPSSAEEELAEWWRDQAEAEIEQTVAKAVEYGSTDLVDIGQSLARVAGREIDDQEAAEWGIFFYLEGKLSRWRSAITDGREVSNDTLLDIGVYARMAQRIREAGSWPGVKEDDE